MHSRSGAATGVYANTCGEGLKSLLSKMAASRQQADSNNSELSFHSNKLDHTLQKMRTANVGEMEKSSSPLEMSLVDVTQILCCEVINPLLTLRFLHQSSQ